MNDVCVYHRHMRDLFLIKRHLDRQGLDYVLTEGAMLSALKFRKLMPWCATTAASLVSVQ